MFNPASPFDPAGDVMRHYRKHASTVEFVSLKHYEIRDLVPLMGHLAELKVMKTLVLADNLITRLPEDMSELKELETLDLSRNPIPNAASVIRGLFSLPKLRSLNISIPEEEEDQLVAMLSHLTTLNGVPLGVDVIPQSLQQPTPQGFLESLRSDVIVDIPRGYSAGKRVAQKPFQIAPWSSECVAPFQAIQRAVDKVADGIANHEEYSDYVELIESHVFAKTRSEPDPLKSARSQLLGKFLLIEYSIDQLSRAVGKFGPDVVEAVHQIFSGHLQVVSEASTLIEALQNDRDAKIDAVQEDLAKELLLKERASSKRDAPYVEQPQQSSMQTSLRNDVSAASTPDGIIPIQELRATAQHLFDSKKRHDTANHLARLPCETVEQHIYTFLYSRCVSDAEITQRVRQLFRSIKYHSKHELDIEVLSLILRHEVDENCWQSLIAHRSVVNGVIANACSSETTSDPELDEDVALQIARTVIESCGHSDAILKGVRRVLASSEGGDRLVVSSSVLGTTILRCLVAEYIVSVRPLAAHFHQFDTERSGVISISRLRELLRSFLPGISSARIQEVVLAVDPFSNDVVSFSDLVKVLRTAPTSSDFAGSAPFTPETFLSNPAGS